MRYSRRRKRKDSHVLHRTVRRRNAQLAPPCAFAAAPRLAARKAATRSTSQRYTPQGKAARDYTARFRSNEGTSRLPASRARQFDDCDASYHRRSTGARTRRRDRSRVDRRATTRSRVPFHSRSHRYTRTSSVLHVKKKKKKKVLFLFLFHDDAILLMKRQRHRL